MSVVGCNLANIGRSIGRQPQPTQQLLGRYFWNHFHQWKEERRQQLPKSQQNILEKPPMSLLRTKTLAMVRVSEEFITKVFITSFGKIQNRYTHLNLFILVHWLF